MLSPRGAAAVLLPALVANVLLLGGSGSAVSHTPAPSRLTGRVLAGGDPVSGSTVSLFVTDPSGVASRVGQGRTNGLGQFSVPYAGPVADGSVVYAVAAGGAVPDRKAFRLMAIADPQKPAPSTLTINELTTVAAAYSVAQFLHGDRIEGRNPGLRNAARTVRAFVKPGSGTIGKEISSRPNGNKTTSLATFRSLANLVAGCTAGGRHSCHELMAVARARGAKRPTNTLAAIHDIALDPTHHHRRIFRLDRTTYYRPQLAKAPTAWILTLKHTAGGFDGPGRMAFDSHGNIYVTNNFEPPGTRTGTFAVALDPTGHPRGINPVAGGGLLGVWWGIAVDQKNHLWVSDYVGADKTPFTSPDFQGGQAVAQFTAKGKALSPVDGWRTGSLQGPQGIAVDQQGNVWIANHVGNSVTEYVGGDPSNAKVYTGGGIRKPFAVAVDGQGNVWVDDNAIDGNDPGYLTKITPAGDVVGPIAQDSAMQSPQGMAFDSQGNLWVAGMLSNDVTEFDGQGNEIGHFATKGILGPWGIAVDGDDHVWVASFWGQRLTELCGSRVSTCPPGYRTGQAIAPYGKGYTNGGLQKLTAVQIDASGNAWVANNWASAVPIEGGDGLVEYVGIAAPVRTPLIGLPQRP